MAIELTVEDLFPRAEVEATTGNGHDHLAPHDLTLQMGVAVILAGLVVTIPYDRFVRCQALQPLLVIGVQSWLVIIDEDAGSDVHRVDQTEPLVDPTLVQSLLDLSGIDHLQRIRAAFSRKHLAMIGITVDREGAEARRVVEGRGVDWPQIWDRQSADGPVPRLYDVREVPRSFLIDRQGRIAGRDLLGEQLDAALAASST